MVKFPDPIREKNNDISYINNAFSEYIGSHIFELCGFNVQKTILGKFLYHDKEKIVCACKDFIYSDKMLLEFESLALNIFSALKENGNKIHYVSYIKDFKNNDVTEALRRVFPKINLDIIHEFIDNIEGVSDIRKAFYKKIIQIRYEVLKNSFVNLV